MKKKIPKYILNILEKRKNAASNYITTTEKISEWLEKENIPETYVTQSGARLEDYVNSGCISLCEPHNGYEGFIRIIEAYFEEKDLKKTNDSRL